MQAHLNLDNRAATYSITEMLELISGLLMQVMQRSALSAQRHGWADSYSALRQRCGHAEHCGCLGFVWDGAVLGSLHRWQWAEVSHNFSQKAGGILMP